MKYFKKTFALGLSVFPLFAFAGGSGLAHVGAGPLLIIASLIILVLFSFFFAVGHFRDRKNRFRYSSTCVGTFLFLTVITSLFFYIPFAPLFCLIIGVGVAEYKAKKDRQQQS